jgi:hypothetical protein
MRREYAMKLSREQIVIIKVVALSWSLTILSSGLFIIIRIGADLNVYDIVIISASLWWHLIFNLDRAATLIRAVYL